MDTNLIPCKCGKQPVYGDFAHNRMRCIGFFCDCGYGAPTIGGNKRYCARAWNEERVKDGEISPNLWAGSLEVNYIYMGGSSSFNVEFAFFTTNHPHRHETKDGHEYIIDKSRYLKDLVIRDLLSNSDLDLSTIFGKRDYAYSIRWLLPPYREGLVINTFKGKTMNSLKEYFNIQEPNLY